MNEWMVANSEHLILITLNLKWSKQFKKKEDDCVICIIMPTPLKKTLTADVHL